MMLGRTLGIRGVRLLAAAMAYGVVAFLAGGWAGATDFNPFSPSGGASPSSTAGASKVSATLVPSVDPTPVTPTFTVTITPTAQTVIEGPTGSTQQVLFTVVLGPQPATQPISVTFTTLDGTATAGQDYLFKTGIVTFNPGETQKPISVTVSNATPADLTQEFFYVILSNSQGAAILDSVARVTIVDNATQPPPAKATLNVSDAADVFESRTGAPPTSVFKVSLSKASASKITVQYSTANGTAKAGVDYKSASGTLTFNAGQTSKFVNVKIIKDKVPNQPNPKTFFLNIFNAKPTSAVQIGDGQGRARIFEPS